MLTLLSSNSRLKIFFLFLLVIFVYSNTSIMNALGYENGIHAVTDDRGLANEISRDLNNSGSLDDNQRSYVSNDQGGSYSVNIVERQSGDGGGGYTPTETRVDPRSYERWRVIGEAMFYGLGYIHGNQPCTGAPGEDIRLCNNMCTTLAGWSCDVRPHNDPVTLELFVDDMWYDTFQPTISAPVLTHTWWANTPRSGYTPNCGDSLEHLYDYRY